MELFEILFARIVFKNWVPWSKPTERCAGPRYGKPQSIMKEINEDPKQLKRCTMFIDWVAQHCS